MVKFPAEFREKYKTGVLLSDSIFGRVYRLENSDAAKFVAKIIRKDVFERYRLPYKNSEGTSLEEITMSSMPSQMVPKVVDSYSTDQHFFLVMKEYSMSLDALFSDRDNVTHESAQIIFEGMAAALKGCHDRSICHRDVKLENFLWDDEDERVLIIDFGFAWDITKGRCKDFPGTCANAAPELVLGCKEYDGKRTDVWALGICFFLVLCQSYPFRTDNLKILAKQMEKTDYSKFADPNGGENYHNLTNLIFMMLAKSPSERIGIDEVVERLRKIDWKPNLINKSCAHLMRKKQSLRTYV